MHLTNTLLCLRLYLYNDIYNDIYKTNSPTSQSHLHITTLLSLLHLHIPFVINQLKINLSKSNLLNIFKSNLLQQLLGQIAIIFSSLCLHPCLATNSIFLPWRGWPKFSTGHYLEPSEDGKQILLGGEHLKV